MRGSGTGLEKFGLSSALSNKVGGTIPGYGVASFVHKAIMMTVNKLL